MLQTTARKLNVPRLTLKGPRGGNGRRGSATDGHRVYGYQRGRQRLCRAHETRHHDPPPGDDTRGHVGRGAGSSRVRSRTGHTPGWCADIRWRERPELLSGSRYRCDHEPHEEAGHGQWTDVAGDRTDLRHLSLIHISEPTRRT